jgi:large conductance mechanosensitive channel
MRKEFRAFLLRGNIVEIAVAFILATFFAVVITTFVNGVVLPFIAAIFGQPNFDAMTFTVGDAVILYGTFLTAVINFVLVAFVLFLVVKAYNRAKAAEAATTRECPYCMTAIPLAATRCGACTSEVTAATT